MPELKDFENQLLAIDPELWMIFLNDAEKPLMAYGLIPMSKSYVSLFCQMYELNILILGLISNVHVYKNSTDFCARLSSIEEQLWPLLVDPHGIGFSSGMWC